MRPVRLFLVVLWLFLVYAPIIAQEVQPQAPALPPGDTDRLQGTASGEPSTVTVPPGTRLPLVLHNAISTRNAHPGDPVYLETVFPVVVDGRVVVPAGSYVQGEIDEARRPGRVKGEGEVRIRLTTIILPNGYTARFDAVPTNAGTGGGETTTAEGQIKGDTDKASDVGTVVKTTSAGAAIGGLASRSAKGAGIGAGAGAAAGLAAVLLTRGPELVLPRGTTLDVVLDRPMQLDASRINFNDPGRASAMPGPPNREPIRDRKPF
jgi:type IV secretion system protein VirB10